MLRVRPAIRFFIFVLGFIADKREAGANASKARHDRVENEPVGRRKKERK
jgi:hypothetical protein